jgi:hypothetical protein
VSLPNIVYDFILSFELHPEKIKDFTIICESCGKELDKKEYFCYSKVSGDCFCLKCAQKIIWAQADNNKGIEFRINEKRNVNP